MTERIVRYCSFYIVVLVYWTFVTETIYNSQHAMAFVTGDLIIMVPISFFPLYGVYRALKSNVLSFSHFLLGWLLLPAFAIILNERLPGGL